MKFYNAMLSPFAARCRMLIYAKGLEVEFSEAWGDFSKEQLSLINPMGKVPVLEDGDLVLPESETICEYLEDRFPEPALRPESPQARARMRLLGRLTDLYVFETLSPLFGHLSRKSRDRNSERWQRAWHPSSTFCRRMALPQGLRSVWRIVR
jgi:glutathione S-transferase